jgi:hypothetical protein
MNSKFQHHNAPLIIPLREMVTHWTLWFTRILDFQVTVSNILDSDHLPIIFHILDHVKIRNLSEPIEEFTDWERFQSLASDLTSPRLKLNRQAVNLRPSVGQSVLVSGAHLGPVTNFSFSLKFLLDSCGFVIL